MNIYIDVTRLLGWKGNYTGIERVAIGVIKSLLIQHKNVIKLIVFDNKYGYMLLEDNYQFIKGRMISSLFLQKSSLKKTLHEDKIEFIKEISRRKKDSRKRHKHLKKYKPVCGDKLLILDGMWDSQAYIDNILSDKYKEVELIHILHDLIPIIKPHLCLDYVSRDFQNYFNMISPRIDKLLTTSENTKQDFINTYSSKIKKDITIYNIRLAEDFIDSESSKPSWLDSGNFILGVGTVEIRKNYELLYQTYNLAKLKKISLPQLIIVGKKGWLAESFLRCIELDQSIRNKIIVMDSVSDDELTWLYDHCIFTIFPSVYEGWGLPVAESLARGKVCASSNTSSMPEIGGNLNKYFSPYSTDECLRTIDKLLDNKYRKMLEKKIAKEFIRTSWSDTANQIYDISSIDA